MDRIYQAARAQLPIIYEIIDRMNTMFVSRYNIITQPVNKETNTYIEVYDYNNKYNLRPRKPISYKV